MRARGVTVDHTTVFRRVQRYAPELDTRCRRYLCATKICTAPMKHLLSIKHWHYPSRAVDADGHPIDVMRSAIRDALAAPCVITTDNKPAYPPAFDTWQQESRLSATCPPRRGKCWYTVVEQDHRCVKRRVNFGAGFGMFSTAQQTIQGDDAMHRLRKGQIEEFAQEDVPAQSRAINQLFGLPAQRAFAQPLLISLSVFAIFFATLPTRLPTTRSRPRVKSRPSTVLFPPRGLS
jgi:transposase, IS6 family